MNRSAQTPRELVELHRALLAFRRQFLRAETTLDYFADAIATRTNAESAALLRACDSLAYRSMAHILDQIGKPTPAVLTYFDKGLGASILKAGLRLWDGGAVSPVAAVKITRHNLLRPTALIHEAGHQVAHITGWNEELSAALSQGLAETSSELAGVWSGWASEIAADASRSSIPGSPALRRSTTCWRERSHRCSGSHAGDPHPICYLRVLLGVEMCRYFYGAGPWDDLARSWTALHSLASGTGGYAHPARRVHAGAEDRRPHHPRYADAGVSRRDPSRARASGACQSRRAHGDGGDGSARRCSRRRTGSGPSRCASSR